MRLRHVLLFLAALFATAPGVSAGEGGQQKSFKTPQAVFDAAQQATAKDRWKEAYGCLTPKSGEMLTGVLVVMGSQMENAALAAANKDKKEKNEELEAVMRKMFKALFEPIHKVYAKHGLTEKVLKELGLSGSELFVAFEKGRPEDREKLKAAFAKAAKRVKDKPGFVEDWMKAMLKLARTFGKGDDKGPIDLFGKDARLEDLKVAGDTAQGMIVSTKRGTDKREPIHFKKMSGSWLIELPLDELTGKKGKKAESKEKGACAPARLPDVLGDCSWRAGKEMSASRVEGLRSLAAAPREQFAA